MNFSKSRKLDFSMPQYEPVQMSHQSAAGANGYVGFYQNNVKNTPAFDRLSATAVANRSAERAALTKAEADLHSMGMSSLASLKSAQIQADAAKDAARSEANGQMFGSALSAIGTIGGALLLSDATTKENVIEIDDGLSVIKKLKPKTYNYLPEWQSYSNRKHSGFIAQEYQKVIPEGTYNYKESGKLCIDLNEVIAPLVSAVQQLEARITELEKS